MSWVELQSKLQAMKPTGENGFEGLCAKLLSALLEVPFVVARSGTQPSGDAKAFSNNVSLQAKRYNDTTKIKLNEMEGEIRSNIRSIPELETYVICATNQHDNQLDDRIKIIEKETGVDIHYLHLNDQLSEFGALCVKYWDEIRSLKPFANDNNFNNWIIKEKESLSIKHLIEKLKDKIILGEANRYDLYLQSKHYLYNRFKIENLGYNTNFYEIDLKRAIERTVYQDALYKWVEKNEYNVCYLQGEEGYGKSWVAAQFAKNLSDKGATVFWFDSIEWHELDSIDKLLYQGIEKVFSGKAPKQKTEKLSQKILNISDVPVYIVLDGVNEREAVKAAKRILLKNSTNIKNQKNVKFIFTTRPLDLYPSYERIIWNRCKQIKIKPYNDEELNSALTRSNSLIDTHQLSDSLIGVLRIPRYYSICILLSDRLKSINNVTKELVMWEELKYKIDNTDEQIKSKLKWSTVEDAETILSEMAKNSDWSTISGKAILQKNEIDNLIPDYPKVRQDLIELRIANQTGPLRAEISPEHVKLGWALYLYKRYLHTENERLQDTADNMIQLLEPIPSEDMRIEALYIALVFSLTNEEHFESHNIKKAGLMYAWLISHNLIYSSERLELLSELGLDAYCMVLEAHFEHIYISHFEVSLINPLAKIWQENQGNITLLRQYLKKWLLLTIAIEDKPEDKTVTYQGIELPIALSIEQLRLSAVSISIISLRPDNEMINELALCYSTEKRSTEKRSQDNIWNPKYMYKNLGVLFRWGYTEKIVVILLEIAKREENELVKQGIIDIAQLLWLRDLPQDLKTAREFPKYNFTSQADCIREGKRIFKDDKSENVHHVSNIAELAARTDLPKLQEKDIELLLKYFKKLVTTEKIHDSMHTTSAGLAFDELLPWVARLNFELLGQLSYELLKKSFSYENPRFAYNILKDFYFEKEIAKDISDCFLENKDNILNLNKTGELWYISYFITEILLYTSDTKQLIEWFDFISNNTELRKAVYIIPISYQLRKLMPKKLVDFAYQSMLKCEPTTNEANGDDSDIDFQLSKEEFWSFVFADGYDQHPEGMNWLKQKILDKNVNSRLYVPLIRFFTETADIGSVIEFLSDKTFIKRIKERNVCNFFMAGLLSRQAEIRPEQFDNLPYEEYDTITSGLCYFLGNKESELNKWAQNVCDEAIQILKKPPYDLSMDKIMEVEIDNNDAVSSIGSISNKGVSVSGSNGASSWGVYTGNNRLSDMFNIDEENKRTKQETKEWNKQRKQYALWEDNEIGEFNARIPFAKWVSSNSKYFKNFAFDYLGKLLQSPKHLNCMALFTDTVLCSYANFDVELSCKYYKFFRPLTDVVILNDLYIPTFISKIWSLKGNDNKLFELRKQILYDCLEDESIMYNTVAALSNIDSLELISFINRAFLGDELAKNRNVGVSMLAWIANDKSIEILNSLIENDPSSWTKWHAEWALDVAKQGKICRKLYKGSLLSKDLNKISATLLQMKPVLMPIAGLWRKEIEQEVKFAEIYDVKIIAFVEKFWYHWESWSNNKMNIEVNGRKISKWCRGESLDNTVTPRLSPWWKGHLDDKNK